MSICAPFVNWDGSQKIGVTQKPVWIIIDTILATSLVNGVTAEVSKPIAKEIAIQQTA